MKKRHFITIIFCSWLLLNVDPGKGGYSPEETITKSAEHPSLFEVNRQRQRFARLPDFGNDKADDVFLGYVKDEIIVKYTPQAAEIIQQEIRRGIRSGQGRTVSSRSRSRVTHIEPVTKGFQANRKRLASLAGKNRQSLTRAEKQLLQRRQRVSTTTEPPALDRIFRMKVELAPGETLPEVVKTYNEDPQVEYAQLNYKFNLADYPNDNLYALQWALENIGQEYPPLYDKGQTDRDIDAEQAWDISTGSDDVVIAVIDTGVDYTHRDLDENMWLNVDEFDGDLNNDGYPGIAELDDDGDGLIDEDSQGNSRFLEDGRTPNPAWINDIAADDDENGYVDDFYGYDFCSYDDGQWDSDPIDDHGHGTHCAGIIAAEGNNQLDITGVNWSAQIMAVKFLSYNGSGSTIDAIQAIEYAVHNGAHVLSNSWGRKGDELGANQAMQEIIDYAAGEGVIVIAAAGNDNNDNEDVPYYPANYHHVISVAATDSSDAKANFSNFGETVTVAAPGVDILSLRASDTSMGSLFDDTTTVASGTSMAAPQVAGVVALMLSYNQNLSPEQIHAILRTTGDPIADGICQSDARVNANQALQAVTGLGIIYLDDGFYSANDQVMINLIDMNLQGLGQYEVEIQSSHGDREHVILQENQNINGIFHAGILTSEFAGANDDGTLQVINGDIITVRYQDQDNGDRSSVWVTDTAVIDAITPVIRNVRIEATISIPVITFETDEPTSARFVGGTDQQTTTLELIQSNQLTQHEFKLKGLQPRTRYFFQLIASDHVGNTTVADNFSAWYTFITPDVLINGFVPTQFETIQEAIDHAWDGDTIWIADGIYQGPGNYNITFDGRAVTVKSEHGPEHCIIDAETHGRGFIFDQNETPSSVLDGLTIIRGYANSQVSYWHEDGYGGGIYCRLSHPTIRNCILKENQALTLGGGLYAFTDQDFTIENCQFTDNQALYGGGIHCEGVLTLTNSFVSMNETVGAGGGLHLYGDINIDDCRITHNTAGKGYNDAYAWGGGIFGGWGNFTIQNTCISENQSFMSMGGVGLGDCDLSMSNCIIADNIASTNGAGNFFNGNFNFTHCVIANNEVLQDNQRRGLVFYPYSKGSIENSILWHSSSEPGYELYLIDQKTE
ncbi:MAG: S8 family serine peptidase, partial [Planctomycetes bacterium]|nr:S8 family serine peptidase [Planctomycetota bacterium]